MKEMLAKERDESEKKVHDAEHRATEAERLLKEQQIISEKRTEENFTLKQRIDQQRAELEKLRKRTEI